MMKSKLMKFTFISVNIFKTIEEKSIQQIRCQNCMKLSYEHVCEELTQHLRTT